MALFSRYAEYEPWNSNAHTRRIPFLVPSIGEVVFPNCRKLPSISEAAASDADKSSKLVKKVVCFVPFSQRGGQNRPLSHQLINLEFLGWATVPLDTQSFPVKIKNCGA